MKKALLFVMLCMLASCGASMQEEISNMQAAGQVVEPTVPETQALLIYGGLEALFGGEKVQTVQARLEAAGNLTADEVNGLWDIYKAVKGVAIINNAEQAIGFSARKAYLDLGIGRFQAHINTIVKANMKHKTLRFKVQQAAIALQLKLQKGIYGITTSAPFFVYSKNVTVAERTNFESELVRIASKLPLLPKEHREIAGPVFISDGKMRQDVIIEGKDKTFYAAAHYLWTQAVDNNFFGNIGKASISLEDLTTIVKPWKTGFTILTTNAVKGFTMEGEGKVGEFSLLHELGHNVDDKLKFSVGKTLADFPGQSYGSTKVAEHAAQAYSRYFLKPFNDLCQKAVPNMTKQAIA